MTLPSPPADPARNAVPRKTRRIHRAWLVAAVTVLALVAAAAFRSTTGAFFEPLESEFGWTRSQLSTAVTINLVVYGLVAPFAATLLERFSMRFVAALALGLVSAGAGLAVFVSQVWQLWLLWGGLVGIGTGAIALVFGAVVANRWFAARRGLVMGIFSAANACGQLIFLPTIVHLTGHHGWRIASLLVAGFALAIVPLLFWPFANSPAEAKTTAYGATDEASTGTAPAKARPTGNAMTETLAVLRHAMGFRAFWILAFTFWICGWSTNGLIQTHFIPASHDHGMPATTASGLLALIGVFDIIGTIASGWLTDRVRPWLLLVFYYGLRGISLLTVHSLLGPTVEPVLWIFILFYGLDWVATVPPTVVLCRQYFGPVRAAVVFGWVFAFHMVGAGVGALTAGIGREMSGSYLIAWITAAVLCFLAAGSLFFMPGARKSVEADPEIVPDEMNTSRVE
ncbi:MFS transporter [Arthrobacter sp. UCD-GKA]|uniref:MFS transporter n=1 Tax=Arthrobacter sp. UCD-GKA TaxID=1913576 RepID=UPI00257072A2|nr:MFS transporter [Arthrobacter sp. UCD-GKA]